MPKKLFSCLMLGLTIVLAVHAQETPKRIPLKSMLDRLAAQHRVNFNYIEEEIIIFKLIPPDENLSLKEKLAYISGRTRIEFLFVSADFISVRNDKSLDKPFCGFLTDGESGLPVESATVHITGTGYSVVSDNKGYFELQLRSANDIEVSHLNYEKINISPEALYTQNCPVFALKPFFTSLDQVNAEVFLTKGITKKADNSYVIKPKQFGLLPGLTEADVFETIKQLPGINSTDETQSNISIRGGTHDQNLFLWNGIRLFQTSHFFGLISALNPHLAQNIRVVKNGSSPFYGESVSGVVDISTHHTEIEQQKASVGLNMINTDFYCKFKLSDQSDIELSSRRAFTDLIYTPTYKSYYNRIFQNTAVRNLNTNQLLDYYNDEDFYFYDFTVQFHQKIRKHTDFYIDAITIYNKLDLNESKVEDIFTISKNSALAQQTVGGNMNLQTRWNEKNHSEFSVYVSYYSINSSNESIENNQITNQENKILDTGIRIKNTHRLNGQFEFHNGYQFNGIAVENYNYLNNPEVSRTVSNFLQIHALIGELQYTSKNRDLNGSLGGRCNYIAQLHTFYAEPRLQLSYKLSNSLRLELLAERKSQTATQLIELSQDFLGIEKRRWTLANGKDIPVLKNQQLGIGFTFRKNNWLVGLDNYYKKVEGITSSSQGFQNQLEFVRMTGDYTVVGSELLVQKQFSKLTAWVSYSVTDNNYAFEDYQPAKFPNNNAIRQAILAGVIYNYGQLKLAVGARWFSGKPNTEPLLGSGNTPIDYQSPNGSNLAPYFQVNTSAGYDFRLTKNVQLMMGASVQNLFNSTSVINQYYRVNQNTNAIEQINTYSLQRTPNAFLRFNF